MEFVKLVDFRERMAEQWEEYAPYVKSMSSTSLLFASPNWHYSGNMFSYFRKCLSTFKEGTWTHTYICAFVTYLIILLPRVGVNIVYSTGVQWPVRPFNGKLKVDARLLHMWDIHKARRTSQTSLTKELLQFEYLNFQDSRSVPEEAKLC